MPATAGILFFDAGFVSTNPAPPFFPAAFDTPAKRCGIFKNSTMATAPLVPEIFREALAQFVTGVTVVTAARASGQVHGMTANSFTSVSLDPPLILVCVDQRAQLLPLIKEHQRFGVSVLQQDQQAISEYFSKGEQSAEQDARLGIRYRWTRSGIPVLANTMVQLACTLAAAHVAGDHTIFIGEVESAEIGSGEPLLFFRSQYRQITS